MKKSLLTAILSAAVICTGITCAYADSFAFDGGAKVKGTDITVEGSAATGEQLVSALVIYPDADGGAQNTDGINISDILAGNIENVKTIVEGEVVSGRFLLRIKMNENDSNGVYTVISADETGALSRKTTFEYYAVDRSELIANLGAAAKAGTLAAYLDSNKEDEGFKNTLIGMEIKLDSYYALGSTYRAQAVKNAQAAEEITLENITLLLNSGIALAELNSAGEASVMDIIRLNNAYFGFEIEAGSDYAGMTADEKVGFAAILSKREFEDIKAAQKGFVEAVALTKINCASTADSVKALIEKYNDIYGFNLNGAYKNLSSTQKGRLLLSLIGNGFLTAEDAKKAFDTKLNSLTGEGGGSGGGGTGGGSGSGTKSSGSGSFSAVSAADDIRSSGIFPDTAAHWAKNYISRLSCKGIVSGSDGVFRPDDSITREEFVKILCCTLDIEPKGECGFNDVEPGKWYAPYIAAMANAGIVSGISTDSFGVGQSVTRQDMAVLISKAMDYAGISGSAEGTAVFADDAEITEYAKKAVYDLNGAGVIKGMDAEHFAPRAAATRAQACVLICGMLDMAQNR